MTTCRSGGTGRRAGLKIQCPQGRVGSNPTFGTAYFPQVSTATRRSGGTGRHARFRGVWPKGRVGSNPTFGTVSACKRALYSKVPFFLLPHLLGAVYYPPLLIALGWYVPLPAGSMHCAAHRIQSVPGQSLCRYSLMLRANTASWLDLDPFFAQA